MERGLILDEAKKVINGERKDVYGAPEDSFELIAEYWNIYLNSLKKGGVNHGIPILKAQDISMMMVLFKIARESNQKKLDNIKDACGYLGIYADLIHKVKGGKKRWSQLKTKLHGLLGLFHF